MMKKSISKKIVSIFAAATLLLTSTSVVLADNVATSESGDQWGDDVNHASVKMVADENGMLTSTRTIFRTSGDGGYTATNGNWAYTTTKGVEKEIVWDVTGETSSGIAQAKFDFKFDGGTAQTFYAKIKGWLYNGTTAGSTGVQVNKDKVRLYQTKGGALTGQLAYCNLSDNVWYTMTMTLDMDKSNFSVKVIEKNSAEVIMDTTAEITDAIKGSYTTPGVITGIAFTSPSSDAPTSIANEMVNGAAVTIAESVWHIANVEYDAYTETNYELENIYKTADGMESNTVADLFSFGGVKLNRLTKIADPANASLITATYDGITRMNDARITPLSSVGTALVNGDVAPGSTIKSFIFDMDTAKPYVDAYTYTTPAVTERSLNFNASDGYIFNACSSVDDITTHGNITKNGLTVSVDNGALKFERTRFRNGSNIYWYDSAQGKYVTSTSLADAGLNSYYVMKLGETVGNLNGSFKIKFDGIDHTDPSACQQIEINVGPNGSDVAGAYLLRIRRYADGSGDIYSFMNTTAARKMCSWTSTDYMRTDEWYTVDFSITGNTTINADLSGVFGNTTKKALEIEGTAKNIYASTSPATFSLIAIGSSPQFDWAFPYSEATAEEHTSFNKKTSVVYIDDIVLKY